MNTILSIKSVNKSYPRYRSSWHRLRAFFSERVRENCEKFQVLQNISIEIKRGECLGILGLNGAGKSTLLKLIAGTAYPDSGNIMIQGRVVALLELGLGFHAEFTGRQNIFLAGQLLGLETREINHLLPEIESFAEIGEYIDQPLRVYSSGMQMRLAFSVAIAKRPDILIIDEALSVGDAYFQEKSFSKIREFKSLGTTILLVSHDRSAVASICDRALLLSNGKVLVSGPVEEILDYYSALLAANQPGFLISQSTPSANGAQVKSGNGKAKITNTSLINLNGQNELFYVGNKVRLEIKFEACEDLSNLVIGYSIRNRFGQVIYGINSEIENIPLEHLKQGEFFIFQSDFLLNIAAGNYSIQVALTRTGNHLNECYEWLDRAILFEVLQTSYFEGLINMSPEIKITKSS